MSSILSLAVQSTQNIAKAVDRFFREAPQEEVRHFRLLWRKVEKKGLRQTHEGQFTNEWKWVVSLSAWDAYQSGNQEQALETIHEWLGVDCAFFLRQWWIIDLIALWYREGKQKEIRRLFEGRRGKSLLQNVANLALRNQQIIVIFEKNLLSCHYEEAVRRTCSEHQKLGLKPFVSEEGIKRIYKQTPTLDPVRDFNIYFAMQRLSKFGLTKKEAEKELAAQPEKHGLQAPLSPALIDQICRRYLAHRTRRT